VLFYSRRVFVDIISRSLLDDMIYFIERSVFYKKGEVVEGRVIESQG
jgi:hypothetical protein